MGSVSASRIGQFRRCVRVWAATNVLGIEQPKRANTSRGLRVHAEIAEYITTGVLQLDRDPLTHVAINYIPDQTLWALRAEHAATAIPSGITCTMDVFGRSYRDVQIIDWKTIPTFEFAQTRATLARDAQAVAYAFYGLAETGRAPLLRWVYLKKTGRPMGHEVSIRIPARDIIARFRELEADAARMWAIVDSPPAGVEDLPGVEGAPYAPQCQLYGGCFLAARCASLPGGAGLFRQNLFR
jgi:RecB family exonuclease